MESTDCPVFYPFAYALLDEYLNDFCWYCLNESCSEENGNPVHLLRCSACKIAYFCSKQCQLMGWSDHKAECKAFSKKKLADPSLFAIPDVEVRMLGRLTWRYKQILDGQDKKDTNFYLNRTSVRNVMELCSHDDEMRADQKACKKFQQFLRQLKCFYDNKFLLDDETIFQLHCRNFINRHGISDRTFLREIGKGLYLDLCWYDHSCRPNSLYIHNGFTAILRPLSVNVALSDRSSTFYTYIDLLQSKEERRRALSDSWYFRCQCQRCIDDNDNFLTAINCDQCQSPVKIFKDDRLKSTNDDRACEKCGQQMEENRMKDGIFSMRQLDNICDGDTPLELQEIDRMLDQYSTNLPHCNIYTVRLLRSAIMRTDPSDIPRLLRYHLGALEAMRICYPSNHPSLAYHLMNIGVFHGQLKQTEESMAFLEEAKLMFQFALGADHFLTKKAQEEMDKIMGEGEG